MRGFGDLVVAAQPLDAAEDIAGVVARRLRDGVEQAFGVARLVDHGLARFGDGDLHAAQPLCRAQARVVLGIEAAVHARLVIGGREQGGDQVERLTFEVGGHGVVAPGFARDLEGGGAVAEREQRARVGKTALGRERAGMCEKRAHGCGVGCRLLPERGLGLAAEHCRVRPVRVRSDECAVALEAEVVILGAQDRPFYELAGERIGDCLSRFRRIAEPAIADGLEGFLGKLEVGGARGRSGWRRGGRLGRRLGCGLGQCRGLRRCRSGFGSRQRSGDGRCDYGRIRSRFWQRNRPGGAGAAFTVAPGASVMAMPRITPRRIARTIPKPGAVLRYPNAIAKANVLPVSLRAPRAMGPDSGACPLLD
ncbi:MAG: hypothetical protein M5U33_03665 [Pseudorhodoplanes sp.]|nr:hypothetical protein [Pseudorhodoplanes sp.]